MKNLIIGQSGGPTSVMNSSLYGAVMEALKQTEIGTIYGMEYGIEGFLKGKVFDLVERIFMRGNMALLMTTPGAYLGSSKYHLPDDLEDEVYEEIFRRLEELEIGYFLYIGGNHSMDTVEKLSVYAKSHEKDINFIGIPKTIDNTMIYTDHVPGYASAAKYIASTVREIITDADVYDVASVTIVELMGRRAGWLTATSALARRYEGDNPMLIYLPEVAFDPEQFIEDIGRCLKERKQVVVCIAEGITDANGKLISEYGSLPKYDIRGERLISGAAKYLQWLLSNFYKVNCRVIELNVTQRCSISMISKVDQDEAIMVGENGVKLALRGMTGRVVSLVRIKDEPYLSSCGMEKTIDVANERRPFPKEWISDSGTDVTKEFLDYINPLIQGYITFPMESEGIPAFLYKK